MIKMTAIGHLGKDAEIKQYGTESVINFSIAHTDKYMNNGVKMQKTTWISCSWWVEKITIAQYLRKGTQVYIEGIPEAKMWKKKEGESEPFLNVRVFSLQLLGGGNRENNSAPASNNQSQATGGFVPYQAPAANITDPEDFSDLPF